MRFILTILITSSSLFGVAQSLDHTQDKPRGYARDKEANSLLWEISGNGLRQTSYLYGTMHVSKRIAFRLDDVFYEALDKSEVIALESDPDTWLENSDDIGFSGYGQGNGFVSKGFYTHPFAIRNPKKNDIAAYLAFEDRRINNILYRTDEYSQNFEEETYLDMFIYQAGKKFGKKVIALENLEESSALVGRASLNAIKQKPDEWLQKKMQQQDPITLLQDAYRNRNIGLLDSIDKAMYTEHYLKNMLFIRNRNMAQKLDSTMRTAKVFAGIGAAHLPGKKGVITMLREMGYTVRPLLSKSTSRGRQIKERFEQYIRENEYASFGPDDGFFSIDLPNKLYPISEKVNTTYISPDLANGSYVMVNRIPTFSYIKQDVVHTINDLDRLLFENIPGKIVEKNRFKRNGFEGLDIKNQLKNGDHQRYHIYLTPLEILIFKMGGDGDYVLQHSDTIFNSIRFQQRNKKMVAIPSGYQDFEVRLPSLYTFPNRFRKGDRLVQGHDSITGAYYFLRKATLNDFNFIEEDTFELKQIQKRLYQDLKLKPAYEPFENGSLTSKATIDSIDNKELHLKTLFQSGDYYLMGALTKSEVEAIAFFNSFKTKPMVYKETFEKVVDTAMLFKTVTSIKPPKFVENSNNYYTGRDKPKAYSAFNKKTIYQNKNNEAVAVELNKSHNFLMFANIDSLWTLRKKLYADKRFHIFRQKDSSFADGRHELELTLTDTASTRAIWIKNIVQKGLLYEIKATVDTVQPPSRFIAEFFEHFEPLDTLVGTSIIADKTSAFFAALRDNDSIVLDGYPLIKFQKRHADSLKFYISEFEFPEDKKNIQAHLIQVLGRLEDSGNVSFFKRFYEESYNNSNAQTRILQSITKKADAASVKLLLALLSKDLPLVSNTYQINSIFKPYFDSLSVAKKLYPELLDYSAIEEYKSPIFSLLAKLKTKGMVKPKAYKKYRKQLLNDAKIQLKRQLGLSANTDLRNQYHIVRNQTNGVLEDYTVLLYSFIKEKEIQQFFRRLTLVKDKGVQTTYAMLLADDEATIPSEMLVALAKDINSRALLFNKLKSINKLNLFPPNYRNERFLAESALFEGDKFNKRQDSVQFIEQSPVTYRGKQYTGHYFKTRSATDYDKNFTMRLVVFENGKGLTTQPFYKNEGLRIEDTDTDQEALNYVTEEFLLKDRQRAEVYRPNGYGAYGYHGY